MAPNSIARFARPGLSLYANLLDPSSNKDSTLGTISRAPVVFKQPAEEDPPQDRLAAEKQQISAGRYEPASVRGRYNSAVRFGSLCAFLQYTASLRFQPTKRPQLSAQKPKSKSSTSRPPAAAPSTPLADVVPSEPASVTARPSAKTKLADWTAEGEDNDVNGFYGAEKRQRGGRKKRKKNKEEFHVPQNWDDIYDPSRPNNYEDYKRSDERIMEIRDWKDKLYAHRLAKRRDSEHDSSGNEYRAQLNSVFLSSLVSADAK